MPQTVLGPLMHNLHQLATDNVLATDHVGNSPASLGVLWPHIAINVLLTLLNRIVLYIQPVGHHAKLVAEQDDSPDLAEVLLGQPLDQSTQLQEIFC